MVPVPTGMAIASTSPRGNADFPGGDVLSDEVEVGPGFLVVCGKTATVLGSLSDVDPLAVVDDVIAKVP